MPFPNDSKIERETGDNQTSSALADPTSFGNKVLEQSAPTLAWRSGNRPNFPTRRPNTRRSSVTSSSSGDLHTVNTPRAALSSRTWWREGPMPRHLRDHLEIRHIADRRSLEPGCMIWVPTKEIVGVPILCIREGHPCGGEQLNDTGFDHPGVILGVFKEVGLSGEEETYCTIAQLRTFKRTSHATYTAGAGQQFRESVPIRYPEKNYPRGKLGDDVEQLDLVRGELFNQTYVQLQHIFKVPASKIMVFHFGSRLATDVKLTDESYVRLMNIFGYKEQYGTGGSVPVFGPSPPQNSRMHGYYGSNFPKTRKYAEPRDTIW